MFITLYKIGEVHFRLLGTNDFYVKAKSERFSVLLRARVVVRTSNMKISRCRLVDYVKTSQQNARAARLVFYIEPIKSLICELVADVAVAKS